METYGVTLLLIHELHAIALYSGLAARPYAFPT